MKKTKKLLKLRKQKMMRLYPESWPSFDNEPTTDKFEVTQFSSSHGEGLKTKVPFNKGDLIFSFSGICLPIQTLFTLQFNEGMYIHDPYVMGKILHSCSPNMTCNMSLRTFYALRDIEAGEILTMDYEETEDELYRKFQCGCQSENCRHEIVGKKK